MISPELSYYWVNVWEQSAEGVVRTTFSNQRRRSFATEEFVTMLGTMVRVEPMTEGDTATRRR